jgi:8-oxo-dGTP pyrophosphatase MutT (NUDIX family)
MTRPQAPEIRRRVAAALLATPDGRYLMQLRDANKPIFLPDTWALFGGAIEPGEGPEAGLRRELEEELEFRARTVEFFTEFTVLLPLAEPVFDRMSFFVVPIALEHVGRMVQHEGADKRLFTPAALAGESRVAPWDLAAVLMHARREALFGG